MGREDGELDAVLGGGVAHGEEGGDGVSVELFVGLAGQGLPLFEDGGPEVGGGLGAGEDGEGGAIGASLGGDAVEGVGEGAGEFFVGPGFAAGVVEFVPGEGLEALAEFEAEQVEGGGIGAVDEVELEGGQELGVGTRLMVEQVVEGF